MASTYFVYILVSRSRNALYVGMTNDLRRRLLQHQTGTADAHTTKYRIRRLVWFEGHADLETARRREQRIKRWRRQWKIDLINSVNPNWRDLAWEIPP